MDINDIVTNIARQLGSALLPGLRTASSDSDLFELYVFCLALKAAEEEDATVSFRDVKGDRPSILVFRTSPGYIYSTTKDYTHAVLEFPRAPALELHIGVRVIGKSGVLHECDVAAIEQSEAGICRRYGTSPRSAKVPIAVECKFYTTPMKLNLARAFVGLTMDIASKEKFFVFNGDSDSVKKFLTERGREWDHRIVPRCPGDVSRLIGRFKIAFQEYKAHSL